MAGGPDTEIMKTTCKFLYWAPRSLCILAIAFISMFAADSFETGQSIGQQLAAFAIQLIPSFVLLAMLLVSWKWELLGGILFTATGLGFSPFIYMLNFRRSHSVWQGITAILMVTIPFMLVGLLFIAGYYRKKGRPIA